MRTFTIASVFFAVQLLLLPVCQAADRQPWLGEWDVDPKYYHRELLDADKTLAVTFNKDEAIVTEYGKDRLTPVEYHKIGEDWYGCEKGELPTDVKDEGDYPNCVKFIVKGKRLQVIDMNPDKEPIYLIRK
jgi:hypothetical protein